MQTLNHKVQKGFGSKAAQYDLYTGLHRRIADGLFERVLQGQAPLTLLDVGCGTGYLTGRLKHHFRRAQVTGLDFAPQMLEAARSKQEEINWVLADSQHLPFPDDHFELVVSNLAYQWAQDLARAFGEARRVLKKRGNLACTLFGYHTCKELFASLDQAAIGRARFNRLPDLHQIHQALLICGFEKPSISREEIQIAFDGMPQLLSWIKSIGANQLLGQGFLGPQGYLRAARIYRERFSCAQGVAASFEVIKVHAQK